VRTERLEFSSQAYSIEAAQKAAYRGLDKFTVHISTHEGSLVCELSLNLGVSEEQLPLLVQEFKKDILDESLREKIGAATSDVRNLILGIAFSRTNLSG